MQKIDLKLYNTFCFIIYCVSKYLSSDVCLFYKVKNFFFNGHLYLFVKNMPYIISMLKGYFTSKSKFLTQTALRFKKKNIFS